MNIRTFLLAAALATATAAHAQSNERYIEVTGTAEIEIVPDRIHYILEIKEYFEEEFDGKSKPEEYRTKVPLEKIESGLRQTLARLGIGAKDIRTQEVGDYWRQQGRDFLVSKRLDITLTDFAQIDRLVKAVDTRGINAMHVGELESDRMEEFHRRGKTMALEAAREKARYLTAALGKKTGNVLRIVEGASPAAPAAAALQSNVMLSQAASFDEFRVLRKTYTMLVRFEIVD